MRSSFVAVKRLRTAPSNRHGTTLRRIGAPERRLLSVRINLSITYEQLGQDVVLLKRELYAESLRLNGEEHKVTLHTAINYANSLLSLRRFEEARPLLRKMVPVARRVLGEGDTLTLDMSINYAAALNNDPDATLDDVREAVTTLEEIEPTARRVLGGVHLLAQAEGARAARCRVVPLQNLLPVRDTAMEEKDLELSPA